eukprot:746087-Hanusia_phi.AAC.6
MIPPAGLSDLKCAATDSDYYHLLVSSFRGTRRARGPIRSRVRRSSPSESARIITPAGGPRDESSVAASDRATVRLTQ